MAGSGGAHLRGEGALLEVRDLDVTFDGGEAGPVSAVAGLSLDVAAGETLGIVGESGCGKTSAARAILQLPRPSGGAVTFGGVDLTKLDETAMRELRPQLQMVHQDPISALNPRRTVREIVAEPLVVLAEERAAARLARRSFGTYVAFAKATVDWLARPVTWLATASLACLVLWVLGEASEGRAAQSWLLWLQTPAAVVGVPVGLALAVAVGVVALLWLGWLALGALLAVNVAGGWAERVPAWLASVGVAAFGGALVAQVLLVAVLDGAVKLAILGVSVALDAVVVRALRRMRLRHEKTLADQAESAVREAVETVGLNPDVVLDRLPRQLSGGQAQRVCIARALITDPKLLICDEPVSSLDVSIQAQILNLLADMRAELGLALVFIAHDLAVVKSVSDQVAVMYRGRLCEVGAPDVVFANPRHPYTRLLLDSVPNPDARRRGDVAAEPAEPVGAGDDLNAGCRFRHRCAHASATCEAQVPQVSELVPGHFVACHHPL